MLEQHLSQEQKQQLTTQQIQKFLLLEIPVEELVDRIQEEIASNPALEVAPSEEENFNEEKNLDDTPSENEEKFDEDLREDWEYDSDSSWDDYASEDDIPTYKLEIAQEKEIKKEEIPFAAYSVSLHSFLQEQLISETLSAKEKVIADYIIGNLTDDGYFSSFLWEVVNDLFINEQVEVTEEEVQKVLQIIQSLEPAGVATKNLEESLQEQINRLVKIKKDKQEPSLYLYEYAQITINDYFNELANHKYQKICQSLKISEETFLEIQKIIRSLNPKPSNGFDANLEAQANRIAPDFTVHIENEQLLVWINDPDNIPSLRISPQYTVLSKKGKKDKESELEKNTRLFARKKVNEASWFIEAINKRRQTLLTVMREIVSWQEEFFRTGDVKLITPMILKDIAEKVDYDVSTISRITSRKYVQSDFGIYSLKFFFSETTNTQEGESVSTLQTKETIKNLIEEENKKKPLSDAQLEKKLAEKGYIVARRTVAKYREQLNIPIARLRKEI